MREIHEKPEIWPFILLSLLIHAALLLLMPLLGIDTRIAKREEVVIPVEFVHEERGARIADIEKPEVEARPKKSSFLGMYDSSVPEEMVGISRRKGPMGEKREARSEKKKGAPREEKGDRLFSFDSSIFEGSGKRAKDTSIPGEAGAMDDFYPDFRRGARTYLNVLRYPEVEYFVRLKRAFKIAFNPEPSLREHFSVNQVARGSVDVVLGVSVDRLGNLSELFILRGSGIQGYDREALRTVRASAPFSSPPEKFVEDDGQLRMSWTFSVYL